MSNDTIEVFISYSKEDKEFCDALVAHLRSLETQGIITWHDRQILPGTRWDEEIKARLNAADIILLLASANFLATDYCTQVEIPEALRRHEAGEATVMPVILRQCGWKHTPLAAIQAYPEKAKPIKSWKDIDEAYLSVVNGVHLAATEIQKRRNQPPTDDIIPKDEPPPISPSNMEDRNPDVIQICKEAYPNESIRLIQWEVGEKQKLNALFRERRRGWYFQLILCEKNGALQRSHRPCPIFLPLLNPDEHLWEKLTRSASPKDWYAMDEIIRLGIKFPGSEIRLAGQYSVGENVADDAMEQFGIYVPDEELLPALLFVNKQLGLLLISYLKHPDGFAKENMLCDDNTNECEIFDSLQEAQQSLERKLQLQV
jgi:TIR domain